jgi:hypothetical protein
MMRFGVGEVRLDCGDAALGGVWLACFGGVAGCACGKVYKYVLGRR